MSRRGRTHAILLGASLTTALLTGCNTHTTTPDEKSAQATPSKTSQKTTTGFAPRFDGIYGGRMGSDTIFVRFLPDHTAYEVGSTEDATADGVRRWLGQRCNPDYPNGPWPYDTKGTFTSESAEGNVDFTVKNFNSTGFNLSIVSHINGYRNTLSLTFSADPPGMRFYCPNR